MNNYDSFILAPEDGSCALELVPEFAGLSNRLCLSTSDGREFNVLAGLSNREELESNTAFRGLPLFPFANRLDGGSYSHQGERYQFEINESAINNTLHGFLYQLPAKLLSCEQKEHEAKAVLAYDYDGFLPAYPFPVEIRISYCLGKNKGFSMKFEIKNSHTETIPVGVGWHPYFQFGKKVDSLSMRLPPVDIIEVDERMLPTNSQREYKDFESLTLIGSTLLDDSMELRDCFSQDEIKTLLWSEEDKVGIEIWQQTGLESDNGGYKYLQVYIPPDRQSIAIEPVSSGINAFNTGAGLIQLEAGQTFTANCGVRLKESIND